MPGKYWLKYGAILMMALILLACKKDDEEPDLNYRVIYSVEGSGNVQIQQIRYLEPNGFETTVPGDPSFSRAYARIPPGTKMRIQATGLVVDGTVRIKLEAENPENEINREEPFSHSGTTPQTFDLVIEETLP